MIITGQTGSGDFKKTLREEILTIPVNPNLPTPYNNERVTANFFLDQDMVLQVAGKGATQERGTKCEIHDLNFGLSLKKENI